jgi:hypothetical protein
LTVVKSRSILRTLIGAILLAGWVAYVGTTSYLLWRILSGDTPSFLKAYTLGTNAAWVTIGIMLWVATEWFRNRS